MPIEDFVNGSTGQLGLHFFLKSFLVLLLVFYAVFALMLFRQVQLMCRTLPTTLSPLLKFLAIIHVGAALAVLLVVLGFF